MLNIPLEVFHIPTLYMTAGFLYILVSVAAWLMLKNQGAFAPTVWCVGGGVLGLGIILLGLRGMVMPWLSFMVGNSCLVIGNLLHVYSLRREINEPLSFRAMAFIYLLVMLPFLILLLVVQDDLLRFVWNMECLAALVGWTAWLGRVIAERENNKSAAWLAGVYLLLTVLMASRGLIALLGMAGADPVANNLASLWIIVGVVVSAVLGNVAVIGLYLERSSKRNLVLVKEQERQSFSVTLSEKVAEQYQRRSLDEMSSALAHELGQPVTGILIDNNMAQERIKELSIDDARLKGTLDSLDKHAQRARGIIGSIRNFSKVGDTHYEALDVRDILADVERLLAYAVREGKIRLEVRAPDRPIRVIGNRVLLSLVFLNACRNAMQANTLCRPAWVRVSFHERDGQICVLIEDDGPGFSSQALDHVGQAYFTTKDDGMGVGLALSRRIAEQHNGELQLHRTGTLGGAAVELYLPLWTGAAVAS